MGERGDTAGNGQVYSEGGDQGWSMPGVVTLSEHLGSVADMEGSGHTQKELLMGGGAGVTAHLTFGKMSGHSWPQRVHREGAQ